jgi:hypothetical protein
VVLPPPPELPDFIFGALSTEEGRLREARRDRSGLDHPVRRVVLAPEAGEAVRITARVGVDLALGAMELRYSTDSGLDPAVAPPGQEGVWTLPMTRTRLEWDTLAWGCLEEWSAALGVRAHAPHLCLRGWTAAHPRLDPGGGD